MSVESHYSPAQRDALEKSYELLGEHFDNALIIVNAEVASGAGQADCSRIYWAGGYMAALGMAEAARSRMLKSAGLSDVKPDDDE